MKVLMVHNAYLIRGGEEESTEAEMRIPGGSSSLALNSVTRALRT